MLKKPFALGLIAVGLIITPGTALADMVIQNSQQSTVRRDGAAVSGSVDKQTSKSISIQGGTRRSSRTVNSRPKFCSPYRSKQQNSTQVTRSGGVYTNSSVSKQNTSMAQRQVQKTHAALCRKLPN